MPKAPPTALSVNKPPTGLVLRNGIYHMRFRLKGVAVSESTFTGNTREAVNILAKRRAKIVEEMVLGGLKPIKLHAAIDEYVKSKDHTPGQKNAKMHLELFKSIPDKYLGNVTEADAMSVIHKRLEEHYELSTCAVSVNYFNALVNFASKRGYTSCSKLKGLKGVKHRIRFLTQEEQDKLFATIDPDTPYWGKSVVTDAYKQDNLDLCWMLLHLGCRYSEVGNMKWSQVDFGRGTVHVIRGKGGRDSTLVMTKKVREILLRRKAIALNEWVFDAKQGRHNESHWMQAAVKRAELDESHGSITLHTLRHTAATRWINSGLAITEVQQMLGHANIQTTMIYVNHSATHTAKRAAAMIDEAMEVEDK